MSVLVVGLSHHTAPIELLERAALGAEGARDLAARVHEREHVAESLVLATCNRLEVVVEADTFHGALTGVGEALCEITGLEREALASHLYVHYDERAVAHLFELACGLDSMAVGESQILGQLRDALAAAQQDGRLGATLNPLLQQALRVGKRAHSETTIDRVSHSLVGTGLDLARSVLSDLSGAKAVVVGAGAMSGLAVSTLARAGVTDLTIVNRTRDRAERLAAQHGARVADWVDAPRLVGGADLVLTCTGAVGHVVDADRLARARADQGRSGAPLVLLDLALPRDVDPAVTSLAGVRLWGLAELRDELETADRAEHADGGRTAQDDAVDAVRALVSTEVAGYVAERRTARLGPTLAALRAQAARVVDAEMSRLDQRVPHLPDDERAEVRRTVQRVVDKLLHTPTVRVKQLQTGAGNEPGDYATALRELFDLDPHEVAVVAAPPLEVPDITAASEAARAGGAR
ncbi:glutamyl-tRNA reductase [Ornithinimicrobium pekingense]|uniref:Glutamyl-tRNA reductase n=1 Tax=Ornithinimicrobium pekingense TaxID=384677 RepID=A0ABQ2F3I3_9MICO|nr:glutamyl-tRNA reductase [Ornithinimicrobium pekingense]GGK58452.1 glutamyl-tRNA reductase [Ornithinimicrobium pekingense]